MAMKIKFKRANTSSATDYATALTKLTGNSNSGLTYGEPSVAEYNGGVIFSVANSEGTPVVMAEKKDLDTKANVNGSSSVDFSGKTISANNFVASKSGLTIESMEEIVAGDTGGSAPPSGTDIHGSDSGSVVTRQTQIKFIQENRKLVFQQVISGETNSKREVVVPFTNNSEQVVLESDLDILKNASGISISDEGNIFSSTNVEGALVELHNAIGAGGTDAAVTVAKTDASGSTTYTFSQGSNQITNGAIQVPKDIALVNNSNNSWTIKQGEAVVGNINVSTPAPITEIDGGTF